MAKRVLYPVHVNDNLQILNYDELLQDAQQIERRYSGYIGTACDCRKLKRRVNKLSRRLNDLRKAKARPYRLRLKNFKGAIDTLRSHLGHITDNLNNQLETYQKRDQQKILGEYQPIWKHLCKTSGVKISPVPKDIIKRKSYSREKRLKILSADVKQLKRQQEFEHSAIVHGEPVTANANGEIEPIRNAEAHTVTFVGTHLQWLALKEFAKKNGIQLRESH